MVKKGRSSSSRSFLEKLVGWYVIITLAVLPLVYFSNRAASYVTSKQYFLIGTVDILIALWTWLLLIDARYRLTRKNALILGSLLLFLLSLTVSSIMGVDPATSFFSIPESGTGLILLYHAFIFACIVASYVRVQKEQFVRQIARAVFFASVILAGMTFLTGPTGLFDIHSAMLNGSTGGATIGNPLLVGAYFIFAIFLTLYLIVNESIVWKKIVYLCGIALIVFCPTFFYVGIFKGLPLSSSYFFLGQARIATVSLAFGLVLSFFIWLWASKGKKIGRIIGIAGVAVIVIFSGLAMQKIISPTSHVHAFFIKESGNRIIDWQESLKGIQERPLLGWGLENSHVVYQKFLDPIIYSPGHGNEVWALHPHNSSLEILVDGGIIGFLCYMLILASLFGGLAVLYKKGRIDGKTFALMTGMLVAFVMQQQMVFDSIVSYVMLFSVLAIIAGLNDSTDDIRNPLPRLDTVAYTIGITVTVICIPLWICLAYLPAQKMNEFLAVTTLTSDVRAKAYQHLFHSAGSYAIDTDPEFFTDPFFYSYDSNPAMLKSNPQYQKLASDEIAALIAAVDPIWQKRFYNYHLTLSLIDLENLHYYLTGDTQDLARADIYAKRAFVLSPTDPQLYFAYAETMVYKNDTKAAVALLDKALVLNPQYAPAANFKQKLLQR